MDNLFLIASYLDEMDEIVINTATEYFDENRLKELKGLLTDAFSNVRKMIQTEAEKSVFSQMNTHFAKLSNCF